MKAFIPAVIVVLLFAHAARAQSPEVIAKKRAKELSNQNNVRQGVTPPTQGQPLTAQPQPANPAPQPQNPALTKLQTDLAAIQAGSTPSADQKQKLSADILA